MASLSRREFIQTAADGIVVSGGLAASVAVGKGSVDWVKTFQAATLGGVKNYFVEQTMELTRVSVAALKALKV